MITVYVAYATPHRQIEIPVTVENNCSVAWAIKRSGILQRFTELNQQISELSVGIYGHKVSLDASLNDQDRIEMYRPLCFDPKAARRRRISTKK